MKKGVMVLFLVLASLSTACANNSIEFVSPTPANGINISEGGDVTINMTLVESNLTNFTFNWDGTNHEFYGDNIVVMMNLDNVSELGEDDTLVKDISGNGYDGAVTGAVYVSTGKHGGAYSFDGVSDAINLGDIEMGSWTDITVSAWAKTSDSTNTQRIVVKDQVGTPGNFMLWFTNGDWEFRARDGTWKIASISSTAYNDGEWHHFAGVVDNANNAVKLYIDGLQVGSNTFNSATLDDSDNEELVIGTDSHVGSYEHVFNGEIDEVRVYDKALNADEITQLANSNLRRFDTDDWGFIVDENDLEDGTYLYNASAINLNETRFSTGTRTLIVDPVPELTPEFTVWAIGDPHIQTDLPSYRSYEEAINDSLYGGTEGGPAFNWTLSLNMGDWTGGPCPANPDGQDVIEQFEGSGVDQNLIYGITGNHDGSTNDNWFKNWIDPLGTNTATSGINNSLRPSPVRGEWNRYYFEVGNVLFLMLSDWNEPSLAPFGRTCSGGHPAGRVTNDTFNWWVDMIESHPDHIIISTFHQALINTTAYTNLFEGVEQGIHGNHTWADSHGSSMLYAIDNWSIDGLDENHNFVGERPYGFKKYIT